MSETRDCVSSLRAPREKQELSIAPSRAEVKPN